jgi:hypothetical protein
MIVRLIDSGVGDMPWLDEKGNPVMVNDRPGTLSTTIQRLMIEDMNIDRMQDVVKLYHAIKNRNK